MIALSPPAVTYSDNDTAKQEAANKQMSDLLQRVRKGEGHRTLTKADRKLLENEGYAPDLINNLVYTTQRFKGGTLSDVTDKLVCGFTDAAIDPSIYASPKIRHALKVNNNGNCAFCESHLSATEAGNVFHFRPAAIIEQADVTTRSPYYPLAYDINNLHYACKACCESLKQSQFPVSGQRYPMLPITEEKSLLLDPYIDKPAEFIGFSALTGFAYPLDIVQDYFFDTQKMAKVEVKQHLVSNPEKIPVLDEFNHANVDEHDETNQAFSDWIKHIDLTQYRGYQTIRLFALNRLELLHKRFALLQSLYSQFQTGTDHYSHTEFIATCNDAIATWSANKKKAAAEQLDWQTLYAQNPYAPFSNAPKEVIPNWLMSRLIYFVRESELTVVGKRRIVYLGADDLIYGSDNPEKSVFLSIDWRLDTNKALKVRNRKLTWETSFSELAHSHPLEISKLFANNEIWAEGDFEALA